MATPYTVLQLLMFNTCVCELPPLSLAWTKLGLKVGKESKSKFLARSTLEVIHIC